MKKVLIIGGSSFDSIIHLKNLPEPKSQTIFQAAFNETLGSTGAGKALNLARLNIDTTLHSIIGDDCFGEKIAGTLKKAGVNFLYDIDPIGTERHVNLMDEDGGRISIFVTSSSSDLDLDMARLDGLINGCDILVLNITAYTKKLIPLIKKYDKPVWTDLHDYSDGNPFHEDYIEIADYIFVSSDNMDDYRRPMERWIAKGKKLAVCTHGKGGSTALTRDGSYIETPVIGDYKLVDANGAGDSFFSGFLYGFLKEKSLVECLRLGTICAGLCITSNELAFEGLSEKLLQQEYKRYYR